MHCVLIHLSCPNDWRRVDYIRVLGRGEVGIGGRERKGGKGEKRERRGEKEEERVIKGNI